MACSHTCGDGTRSRHFNMIAQASNGGEACPTTTSEQESCADLPCPVDCVSTWGAWGACSEACGPGVQTRTTSVTQASAEGGVECPDSPEEKPCTVKPCPVDCEGAYGDWSACPAECGTGLKETRNFQATVQPDHGGEACPLTLERSCDKPCPVNCVGQWTEWEACPNTCGSGGRTLRTFTVSTPADHGGVECPELAEDHQYRSCTKSPCPVDCVGAWGAWGECSKECGSGTQARTFAVQVQDAHGGKQCEAKRTDDRACNLKPCPVHCDGRWGAWSDCTKSCGDGGKRTRNYVIVTQKEHGGNDCPAPEEEECNTDPCPINCEGSWTTWTRCSHSCGAGTQSRAFNIRIGALHGGVACPSDRNEAKDCLVKPCPINCAGSWAAWSNCNKNCGTGSRTRQYSVRTAAAYGGQTCPSAQSDSCNTDPCPVNCQGQWNGWSSCSKSCASGTQSRTWRVTVHRAHGGHACPATQSQTCNKHACPVNCAVGWGGYGACSKNCGGGTKRRTQQITRNPSHGGSACPSLQSQDASCNTHVCACSAHATSYSDNGNGDMIYLDRHEPSCGGSKFMHKWHLDRGRRRYQRLSYTCCDSPKGRGGCRTAYTGENVEDGLIYLDRQNVECGANEAMTSYRLERTGRRRRRESVRYKYQCCTSQANQCTHRSTNVNDDGGGRRRGQVMYLDRHTPQCSSNEVMKGWYMHRADGGGGRRRRAGGVSVRANCCRV